MNTKVFRLDAMCTGDSEMSHFVYYCPGPRLSPKHPLSLPPERFVGARAGGQSASNLLVPKSTFMHSVYFVCAFCAESRFWNSTDIIKLLS